MRLVSYDKLLDKIKSGKTVIFIDVRTPKEYEEDHIPNAVNIPLFSNEEHAEIGTLYKQMSPTEAKRKGVQFISKSLPEIFEKMSALSEENRGTELAVYCARGGMRSSTFGSLFSNLGMPIAKVDGGYKSYRMYVRETLPKVLEEVDFITLFGKTGCGKTIILQEMERQGIDILDLEGYANHRGSLLGHIGLSKQYGQKRFESMILHKVLNRKSDIMYTEGESKRIGKIVMENYLYDKLQKSKKIEITAPMETRVQTIKKMYINENFKDEDMYIALEKMKVYMSNKIFETFIDLLKDKNYDMLIEELMINYYDKVYKSNQINVVSEASYEGNLEKTIKKILEI